MKQIIMKINGERNSGTGFLTYLLRENFEEIVNVHYVENGVIFYSKHRDPIETVKTLFFDVIHIDFFIIRELEKWLVSMFNNPYDLEKIDNFEEFLICQQKTDGKGHIDFITKKEEFYENNGKTIFEIRYDKMQKYLDYFHKTDHNVLINLDYIQDDTNCNIFLDTLQKKYNLKRKNDTYVTRFIHTKDSSVKEKNRTYEQNIDNYIEIIEKYGNNNYEVIIKDLFWIKKDGVTEKISNKENITTD